LNEQKLLTNGQQLLLTNSGRKTKRDTLMMKKRLQNPLLFTRQDDLALSRRQGRQLRTIQHWKSEMKEFQNVTSFVKV